MSQTMNIESQMLPGVIKLALSAVLNEPSVSQNAEIQVNGTQPAGVVTAFASGTTQPPAEASPTIGSRVDEDFLIVPGKPPRRLTSLETPKFLDDKQEERRHPSPETAHYIIFKYRPKHTRKPRNIEPAPIDPTNDNDHTFPSPTPDLPSSSSTPKECSEFKTDPFKGRAKEKETLDGIKSGKYFSMIHQFPDIIESHGRGPTNLNRTTWEIVYDDNFVPLTDRGREKIAQHEIEKRENEKRRAYERKTSVKFRNALKRIFGKKTVEGKKYGEAKDLGLPRWAKEEHKCERVTSAAAMAYSVPHPPRQYRGPRIEEEEEEGV